MNAYSQAQTTKTKPAFSITPVVASTGLLQRKCACGGSQGLDGECEGCRKKRLQRQSAGQAAPGTVPPIVHDVLRAPGQSLAPVTRAFMEPRFGHDFSRVRVHTDTLAAESAASVAARAYTVGTHIVFGRMQYQPNTTHGRRLLAHELTHVIQQADNLQRQPAEVTVASPDNVAEAEAERAADAVVGGNSFTVAHELSPRLARTPEECTYGEIRSWAIVSNADTSAPAGLADAKASIGAVCSSSNCYCVDGSSATAPGDQHAWSNIVAATGGSDGSGGGTHMCVGTKNCGFVHRCSCPDGKPVERLAKLQPSGQVRVSGKGTLYFYDVPRNGQCPEADRKAKCPKPPKPKKKKSSTTKKATTDPIVAAEEYQLAQADETASEQTEVASSETLEEGDIEES